MKWTYDGMYGDQPYMATGPMSGAPEFGNGNLFNTGQAAMADHAAVVHLLSGRSARCRH